MARRTSFSALTPLLAGALLLAAARAHADDTAPAGPPVLKLPAPSGPPVEERLSSPPDARVETYVRPDIYRPWLLGGLGADLRVKPDTHLAFAAELGGVLPFQIWQGTAPTLFIRVNFAYQSTGTLAFSAGLGAGIFEEGSYRESPAALLYIPQVTWEIVGDNAVTPGFRHDIIVKPNTVYFDLTHVALPLPAGVQHELRLIVGLDFAEIFL